MLRLVSNQSKFFEWKIIKNVVEQGHDDLIVTYLSLSSFNKLNKL